jgi:hypothetical protein
MAYSLIASVSAKSADTNGFTTGSIDTTGANLLVIVAASYEAGPTISVSDSKSNTWTGLTNYSNAGAGVEIRIFWVNNASPTVGSGHTFSVVGTAAYPAIAALTFSNSGGSAFDKESGAFNASAINAQPGSVTPAADNALLICGLEMTDAAATAIDSSFTKQETQAYTPGASMGVHAAYKIQTSAGAENPTWSWDGTFRAAESAIAVFNLATGTVYIRRVIIGGGVF